MACWGAFDAAIEDLCVGMLMAEPDLLRNETFTKLKIPLAQFETLDKSERMRLLVNEVQRAQGIAAKRGVAVFESLLHVFGLDGNLPDEVGKSVWEMHCIRNVIVHRMSLADRRLVDSCPWLGLKINDKVVMTHAAFNRYGLALCSYAYAIIHRIGNKYGADMSTIPMGPETCAPAAEGYSEGDSAFRILCEEVRTQSQKAPTQSSSSALPEEEPDKNAALLEDPPDDSKIQ